MATVQHKDIAEAQLHEPKGASAASTGSVYVSNGAGSGVWKKSDTTTLKGLAGDGGITGRKLLSDGTNGFVLAADSAYGTMAITTNTTNFTTAAAADATLKTTAQYQIFTGTGAPWAATEVSGVTFGTDKLTVTSSGYYRIDLTMSIKAFPSNTAKVATKFRVNGTNFTQRNLIAKSNAAGDEEQLSGYILMALTAGDYVQVCIASNAAGALLVNDADFSVTLLKGT
jgi:hypothetical protein